jgi:hypothetical protein
MRFSSGEKIKHNLRRKDRKMNHQSSLDLLQRAEYGVLSSVDEEGQPYGVPVNFVFDGRKTIYFHCAKEGHKLDNLKFNPKVSFTVVGDVQVMNWKFTTAYESVIVFGVASEVKAEEKFQALKSLALKFSVDTMDEFYKEIEQEIEQTAVVKIKIEHLSGKTRPFEPQPLSS